ncbi:MAG TPA: hypothetical protein DEQ73_02925 [Phycisphaerales bacterium]|nr:MAG: hypothetical protein CBB84_000500 [Phycisphaera sp. TMED24]HCD29534.1 hypothetical protein [Phycisphaerales bacterium]
MTESVHQSDEPPTLKDDLILDALGLLDESESVALQKALNELSASEREETRVLQADWATQAPLPSVTPPSHLRAACIASAARAAEQSPEHHLKLTLNRQAKNHHKATRSAAVWRAAALAMFAGMLAMIMLTNQSESWQGQQARSEKVQRNLQALGVSPKINAILSNRDNPFIQFGQSELGSGQLVWNDSTGDFVLFSRGLPKEVAAVQVRVNEQVVYEQAYLAKGGQFQADAVEQSSLRNTEGQAVTVAFLDQDGNVVLTQTISMA